jgi:integrase
MASGSVVRYAGKRGLVWRIWYRDADGKQAMETVGSERDGVTERRAREVLADRLSDVRRRNYRRPKPLTFEEYAERWLAEGAVRRSWKRGTEKVYARVLRHLNGYFGPLRLGGIRPRDVTAYVTEALERFAPKTVQLHLNVLHDLLSTAKAEELIESNPTDGIERPKAKRPRWRILEPAEVSRVAKAFTDERARAIFMTLILTGIRRSELQALRWRDVDLIEGVLRVRESKTESGERAIALSPALAEELWQLRRRSDFQGDDEFVFAHPTRGTKLNRNWYADEFGKALKTAGIADHVRAFHDARHASLTNGAAAGESPIALMTRAGHSSMGTTKLYLHLAGTVFRDEAETLERRLLGARNSS